MISAVPLKAKPNVSLWSITTPARLPDAACSPHSSMRSPSECAASPWCGSTGVITSVTVDFSRISSFGLWTNLQLGETSSSAVSWTDPPSSCPMSCLLADTPLSANSSSISSPLSGGVRNASCCKKSKTEKSNWKISTAESSLKAVRGEDLVADGLRECGALGSVHRGLAVGGGGGGDGGSGRPVCRNGKGSPDAGGRIRGLCAGVVDTLLAPGPNCQN
mmetsp:Transcript_118262/g.297416  ORF Transcript_118262/g.297416 Transcript_118262/m.297416 type:complete len:219 (+) Transcript_118262:682-1338(+)